MDEENRAAGNKAPHHKAKLKKAVLATVVTLLVLAVVAFFVLLPIGLFKANELRAQIKTNQCRYNADEITKTLEQYAIDYNGTYPEPNVLEELIDKGYMISPPQNPFSDGASASGGDALMKQVDTDAASGFAGNFSYVPLYGEDGKTVVGYWLFVYGTPVLRTDTAQDCIIMSHETRNSPPYILLPNQR